MSAAQTMENHNSRVKEAHYFLVIFGGSYEKKINRNGIDGRNADGVTAGIYRISV